MIDVDVAIAGGGPAGAAAGIVLARSGYRVLLAEAAASAASRIGEGLPPSTRPLLHELGVLERVLAEGHRRSPGTITFWGDADGQIEDSIFGVHGDGLQLDRRRFDARLRAAAREAGASTFERARLRLHRVSRAGAPHGLALSFIDNPAQSVQARWLVDASGRAAGLARACGAQRIVHDRLLAFHLRLVGGAGRDRDARTWVEAVEDGWWYSVLLPSEERLIVFISRPQAAERRRLLTGEGLWHKLVGAPHLYNLCLAHRWEPCDSARCVDAGSAELDRASGEGWLAVGDAALTFDPLASKGIANALYTGLRAAKAIMSSDRGDLGAIDGYAQHLRAIHCSYRAQRREIYAIEMRWRNSTFWSARRL